ncbi:Nucleotidyltransferase domain protein [Candidatus Desulfosporosinus infrequens]|uniref:Nucleotidyltransferase domain protein n=1 Tax=Candidatus Desulfosporosinus infrequens TaxID=2043169 RepID=A0A2U3L8B2_9FIRM|nr:Nucleotidyltransferase domain protein [Candidatus Desulfosporosinus infrequens]
MCPYDVEIEDIKNQLIKMYNPLDIILFGSCAKGRVTRSSDVDICLILETNDKRKIVRDILCEVEYNVDLDVVIYTPQEWRNNKDDQATFAGIIQRTGVSLIGGY